MRKDLKLKYLSPKLSKIEQHSFDRIVTIVGLISGIMTIIQFLHIDKLGDNKYVQMVAVWLVAHEKGVVIFTAILWCLCFAIISIKYRSSAISRMNVSSFSMSDIVDDAKQAIYNLQSLEKKKFSLVCNNINGECEEVKKAQEEVERLYRSQVTDRFLNYSSTFLDKIKDILEVYVGCEVSTCYKMFTSYVENGKDIGATVTFVRDSKSDKNRKERDSSNRVPLERNSDFFEIISSDQKNAYKTYFYQGNLKDYEKKLKKLTDNRIKYENSNIDWENYYIGAIVVPVKYTDVVDGKKIQKVVGFLCADSLSKKAFRESQKGINVRLMQCFADIYSLVMKEYDEKLDIKRS